MIYDHSKTSRPKIMRWSSAGAGAALANFVMSVIVDDAILAMSFAPLILSQVVTERNTADP